MAQPTHTLVQVTDTHVVAAGWSHGVDALAHLQAVLAAIVGSRVRPAALLLTGDVADRGEPGAYGRVRDVLAPVLEQLGCPALVLPGNHDDRRALAAGLGLVPRPGGTLDWVHDAGGLRLVGLDTTIPGADHGALRDAQLAWLAEVLTAPAPHGTVLALHHPPVHSPVDLLDGIGLRAGAAALATLLAGSDVRMVLAGHAHHATGGALGGVPVWCAPASAYAIDVGAPAERLRGLARASWTRVDVFDDGVVATAVPVDPDAAVVLDEAAEVVARSLAEG